MRGGFADASGARRDSAMARSVHWYRGMNRLMRFPIAPTTARRFTLPKPGHTALRRAARGLLAACLTAAAPVLDGGAAFGADGPKDEPAAAAAQPPSAGDRPDFLFGQPRGMVGISGGWLRAGTEEIDPRCLEGPYSESGYGLLRFFSCQLTIGERGYDSPLFRFAFGAAVAPRVDLVFDVDVSRSRVVSDYRHYTEGDLPIDQTTELTQVPLNIGVRFWLTPRGRRVGRLAWVPNTLAFHVGAGVGARWYRLAQFGDFVNTVDLGIDSDRFVSQGWAASRHVAAGVSIRLSPRVFAVADVRRVWSQRELADEFSGRLDLNGLQMTGGIEFVF